MLNFLRFNKIQTQLTASVLFGIFASLNQANATTDALKISTGNTHSCMVTQERTVECWGDNTYGKLGRTGPSKLKAVVPGLTNVIDVAVGDNHSCALLANNGGVKCWGANNEGQLGNGTTSHSTTPVFVPTSEGATKLAVGAAHSCFGAGSWMLCWGRNNAGQLGQGSSYAFSASPSVVMANDRGPLFTNGTIVAGANHTCAISSSRLYCWGAGGSGQLGNGNNTNAVYPVLTGVTSFVNIASAGTAHTCVSEIEDVDAYCWGNWGGLTYTTPQLINVVSGNNNESITGIDSGNNHVCVTISNGDLRCFGQNLDSQVGNGSSSSFVAAPTSVVGISSTLKASAGGSQSCALLANGSIACWGLNGWGQLGDGTQRKAVTPVSAGWWKSFTPTLGVTAASVGYSHACALKNNQVKCWGNNSNGQVGTAVAIGAIQKNPVLVGGLTGNIVSLVSGILHNCVLLDSGTVKCWGGNSSGQLGNGSRTTAQATPVNVVGLGQAATSIMAAGDFTCAVLQDKSAKCWGSNSHGQLGAALSGGSSPTPQTVANLLNVTAISGKAAHACALLGNRTTMCWGANYNGQLGDGTTTNRNVPVANATWINDVIALAAGSDNTCVVRKGNIPWCWGAITGNGTSTISTSPTDVASLSNVTGIAAGNFNACTILTNGTVKCFSEDAANLGDGNSTPSSGNSYYPNSMRWLAAPVTNMSLGRNGSNCAILVTGQLSCWGNNSFGQLGDGTTTSRDEPTIVNL